MMNESKLWQQLKTAALVSGDMPIPEHTTQPWYIELMLAVSGWLSTIFLLIFFALWTGWIFDETATCLIAGSLLLAIAYWILQRHNHSYIIHLALSLSLLGQLLIVIGLFADSKLETPSYWLIITGLEILLALVMPNRLHRFFSAGAAVLSLNILLELIGLPYLTTSAVLTFTAWLWLTEFKSKFAIGQQRAIAYGCSLAIILLSSINQFDNNSVFGWFDINRSDALLASYILKLTLLIPLALIVFQLLKRYQVSNSNKLCIVSYSAVVVISLLSIPAYGIASAMTLLILGWSATNRMLTGIGVVAMLLFISGYYYQLDFTLLEKSFSLVGIATLAFLARWLLRRLWPSVTCSMETDNG